MGSKLNLEQMDKLEAYLKEHKIPYSREDQEPGLRMEWHQIYVYDENHKWKFDVIQGEGTYGGPNGLLEYYDPGLKAKGSDPAGWQTAEDVIFRIEGAV